MTNDIPQPHPTDAAQGGLALPPVSESIKGFQEALVANDRISGEDIVAAIDGITASPDQRLALLSDVEKIVTYFDMPGGGDLIIDRSQDDGRSGRLEILMPTLGYEQAAGWEGRRGSRKVFENSDGKDIAFIRRQGDKGQEPHVIVRVESLIESAA